MFQQKGRLEEATKGFSDVDVYPPPSRPPSDKIPADCLPKRAYETSAELYGIFWQ